MRHSRALFAAALALTAAACGQGAPTEPAANAVPTGPAYGVQVGGGQKNDSTTVTSTNATETDSTTIAGPGSGDGRGVFWGGGGG